MHTAMKPTATTMSVTTRHARRRHHHVTYVVVGVGVDVDNFDDDNSMTGHHGHLRKDNRSMTWLTTGVRRWDCL